MCLCVCVCVCGCVCECVHTYVCTYIYSIHTFTVHMTFRWKKLEQAMEEMDLPEEEVRGGVG